ASRRDLGRPARTRWLSGRRTHHESWDAYEAVDGVPLAEAIATPQSWSRVRHWLSDLASEIAVGLKDGSLPPLAVDRVWIGSDRRARLLDFVPPAGQKAPATVPADLPSAQRFLYAIAAGALRGVPLDAAQNEPPAIPLPLPARSLLEKLRESKIVTPDALAREADEL